MHRDRESKPRKESTPICIYIYIYINIYIYIYIYIYMWEYVFCLRAQFCSRWAATSRKSSRQLWHGLLPGWPGDIPNRASCGMSCGGRRGRWGRRGCRGRRGSHIDVHIKTYQKHRKNWCVAHVAVTPLHRNTSFISNVIKSIEKMKVPFTEPAYLHQVIAFASRMFQNNSFSRSSGCLFSYIFTMVPRREEFIVKAYGYSWLLCLWGLLWRKTT